MSGQIVKLCVNNAISLENSTDVKEEFPDEHYADDKVYVSEATITDNYNLSNGELNGYIKNYKIRNYEMLPLDRIKTDLTLSEVNDAVMKVSNKVKIDGIGPSDIQIKFDNKLLFCSHCHEVYQDYCTKCRVLVRILNDTPCNTYNKIRELPKYMLETRESFGHLGIFSLKVIPEGVRFGPFTGLNSTELSLRIKGGRFVVSDDKLELLNWMQFVNPARYISEQNLFPFQYEDKLYYCSTRRILESEELLVYFGDEYEDNLKNVEMDFVPITKKNVEDIFACTFCCLGFSSKEYLAEHKSACHSEINEMFTVEELVQCPFCKIYLETKEYFELHMDYCRETNNRYSVPPAPELYELEVERRSSLQSKVKRRKRRIYKCTRCKFTTMYNADFRNHTNEHYKVKMYKCGICRRRYKTRESLETHMVKIHAGNAGTDVQKYYTCDYFKATIKNIKETSPNTHDKGKHCQCSKCNLEAGDKCSIKPFVKIKHLNKGKYKCANCEFRTYYSTCLKMHMKIKHLMECNYKCLECKFETSRKSDLTRHTKAVHLKQKDYKCAECEYKAYCRSGLKTHIIAVHLKQKDYKCMECEFKTCSKSRLQGHIKAIHLKQKDYKCTECEYKTNDKSNLERHIKRKHLKLSDYKCMACKYETSRKLHLESHIKIKHLKQKDYKCMECEYETSYKSCLEKHMKGIHLKQNDYKCTECEYETNYKSVLKTHIKAVHLKQKDYKCMECEFKTCSKSRLQGHIKAIHLKQKDYECAECEYKTYCKSGLKTHIKAVHLKQKDYKCMECEFKTSRKSHLEEHIKAIHLKQKDYKCIECEFKTCFKSHLERHRKAVHLKQKDYKCMECEYEANRRVHLETHIKAIHLKQNDYKCMECEYEASQKSNLDKHIKTKHLTVVANSVLKTQLY